MRLLQNLHHAQPSFRSIARLNSTSPLGTLLLQRRWNHTSEPAPESPHKTKLREIRENIYTWPNLLTTSRILSCPVLGWAIMTDHTKLATGLLVYAGLSDWVDGYLARHFNQKSTLGTILDPAADKALVTTLTVSLAMRGLLPLPLAVIIIGRDVALSLSAFWIRYKTLPAPKTLQRYWDFSIPSAEVRPTYISKVNTALQLLLMGWSTVSPLLPTGALITLAGHAIDFPTLLTGLHYTVATTTIWSGSTYLFSKEGGYVVSKPKDPPSAS